MISHDDWDLLQRRINSLEAACFGNSPATYEEAYHFRQRLEELERKLNDIDSKIPEIQPCIDMLTSSFPSLTQKRSSLKQAIEKVEEIAAQRKVILDTLHSLQAIKSLESHIDSSELQTLAELNPTLRDMEKKMNELHNSIARQSQELDEILEIYEQSMLYVNKVCATWEWRLQSRGDM